MIFRSHLNRRFQLLGSCNGLLLAKDETRAFFLTNPTTGEVWKVPELRFELPDEKSYAVYGFGYDSSTDDYKVVSLEFWDLRRHPSPPANTNTVVVTVYSLRSNSWRKLSDFPYGHADFNIRGSALINLNLHWLVRSSTIVTFNLADEQFGEIKLPDSFKKKETWISDVLDMGGKLGVFIKIDDIISELWVMKEYDNSWTRVFSHEFKWNVWPACLVEESDRHVVLNSDHFESTIYVYNVDESRCSCVSIEGSLYDYYFTIEGTYVETLESPARFITSPSLN